MHTNSSNLNREVLQQLVKWQSAKCIIGVHFQCQHHLWYYLIQPLMASLSICRRGGL